MFRPTIFTAFLLALQPFGIAFAEGGCPPGQYPQQGQGWQTCVPIPGYSEGSSNTPPPLQEQWASQWLAIATDTPKGILGTSTNRQTAQDAESAAMLDCHAKGGSSCEVQISYANGCAAMVVGDKLMNTKGGSSKDSAEQKALSKCQEEDKNCRVYYSACSLPKRI